LRNQYKLTDLEKKKLNAGDLNAITNDDKTLNTMIPGVLNSKWKNPLVGSATTTNAMVSGVQSPKNAGFQSVKVLNSSNDVSRSPLENVSPTGDFATYANYANAQSLKNITTQAGIPRENSMPNLNFNGAVSALGNNGGSVGVTTNNGPAGSTSNANGPNGHRYNPITNPVPNNIQNPYLVKHAQNGAFNPRNYFAVMANNNLVSTKQ